MKSTHAPAPLLAAGFALLALFAPPAPAAQPAATPPTTAQAATTSGEWHTFWSVKGRHNTVWLLGSVHLLQPQDSAPPPAVLRAYRSAARLVMELDLGKVGPDALLGQNLAQLTLPEGQTLRDSLGPAAWERFARAAQPLGLDPAFMNRFQPWFAAMTFEQLTYLKLGFDPLSGVDQQFARLAAADGKPIIGLETLDEQLGFFASLGLPEQREFLLQTLDESADTGRTLADTIAAWRRGDTRALEKLLGEGRDKAPALFRRLTTERNQRWMDKLLPLLEAQDDVLVIVGALHLVGEDGLVSLLERRGYHPVQQ